MCQFSFPQSELYSFDAHCQQAHEDVRAFVADRIKGQPTVIEALKREGSAERKDDSKRVPAHGDPLQRGIDILVTAADGNFPVATHIISVLADIKRPFSIGGMPKGLAKQYEWFFEQRFGLPTSAKWF